MTQSRGVRNNNPGNIDYNKANNWEGQLGLEPKTASVPKPRFALFDSPENGIRALGKLVINYRGKAGTPNVGKEGIDTVQEIINRWAPGNENDTGAYVKAVSASVGVKPTDTINIRDNGTLTRLVIAIIRHENGGVPYDLKTIQDGVARALK